jgi:uncharacterized protein (DUF305 family)
MLGNDRTFPPYEIVMIPRTTGEFPSAPGMATPAQLTALQRSSGTAYNWNFLTLMVRHHAGAVTMSRTVSRTGNNLRILELAQEIGVTQTKEITTMQKLLRSL